MSTEQLLTEMMQMQKEMLSSIHKELREIKVRIIEMNR